MAWHAPEVSINAVHHNLLDDSMAMRIATAHGEVMLLDLDVRDEKTVKRIVKNLSSHNAKGGAIIDGYTMRITTRRTRESHDSWRLGRHG